MTRVDAATSDEEGFACLAERLRASVVALDVASSDAAELERLIEAVRSTQAALDAALVRIGLRADALAGGGSGAPAGEALAGRGQVRAGTARREAARAALARRSPALRRVLTGGELGPDHLDSLARRLGRLDDATLDRLDAGAIAADARRLPADTFDASLRRAIEAATEDGGRAEGQAARAASELRHWFDRRTGLGHLTATLDPERYEAVVTAIDQHTTTLAAAGSGDGQPVPKNANLAAGALVELVCSSGARQAHLPHVTVVVDEETLRHGRHPGSIAETGDGQDLADVAIARLCCDAVLRRVVLDGSGRPIDVGRRHRTATSAQWAALRAVHRSCAWTGCDRPLSHCQAHHVRPWQAGGSTDLENLVPLCSQHHHLVHEGRWHVELLPDRALSIRRPDGQPHRTTDRPTRRPPPLVGPRTLTIEPPAHRRPATVG